MIATETGEIGVLCDIQTRTKEPESLLKKALKKDYNNPYEEIRDKAGVRVVCTYRDSLRQLEEVVRKLFLVCNYEDKTLDLGYDRLGYPGIHFEIQLRGDEIGCASELDELVCEIQLLTRAQSLWADISHELAYKPAQEPPIELKRAINLQGALIELFDNQMTQARSQLQDLKGFQESSMLCALDRHYFRFAAKRYDRELSLHILGKLRQLFTTEEVQALGSLLDCFIERKRETLDSVFENYVDDERGFPILFQPESILIFMCLDRDRFRLKETWAQFLPLSLLEGLAEIWGVDIGTVP